MGWAEAKLRHAGGLGQAGMGQEARPQVTQLRGTPGPQKPASTAARLTRGSCRDGMGRGADAALALGEAGIGASHGRARGFISRASDAGLRRSQGRRAGRDWVGFLLTVPDHHQLCPTTTGVSVSLGSPSHDLAPWPWSPGSRTPQYRKAGRLR